MGKFKVNSDKESELLARMAKLGIHESDLDEHFIKGSGPGGQKINKTASCVYIKHLPSGTEVKCQAGRSQALNRFLARRELCEILEREIVGKKSAAQQAHEKIRRQKRRKSRRQRDKMVKDKFARATIKSGRKKVSSHDE